jgi:hypothetical protein
VCFRTVSCPVLDPPSFASSSETRPGSCGLTVCVHARLSEDFLALNHPVRLPLLWFSKDRPSADISTMRPVPSSHSMSVRSSVSRCQTRHAFRPCRSSRLRRLTPHTACTGLLRPVASRGVRGVSTTVSVRPHCCDLRSPVLFPHSHLIPSRAFPSAAAVLCHHNRFLLAVASGSCFQAPVTRPQGLPPLHSPLPPAALSNDCWPDALLGFVPLQGSPLMTDALLKSSGALPPRRRCSGPHPPKRTRPGLLPSRCEPSMAEPCSSQRSYSVCCLPRREGCRGTAPRRPADKMPACP